jgi:transcriptional regulator with XRE-family HTH domain
MAPRRKRPDVHALLERPDAAKDTPAPAAASRAPKPRFLVEAEARRAAAAPPAPPIPAPAPAPAKPARKPRRLDGAATEEDKRLAKNLAALIRERGISGRELSRRADVSLDTARNIITGRSTSPRARTIQALADVLGVPLSALYGGEPPPTYVAVQLAKAVTVQEMAPSASAALTEGDVAAEWSIPSDVVGNRAPERLRIFTAPAGCSVGELRPGDRLLADLAHTEPSPPGLFVMSDGIRTYVAQVCRKVGGRLSVHHGGHAEELDEKAITIVARVVARWTAL